MPSPVLEVILVVAGTSSIAWLGTYLVHSTLAIAGVATLLRLTDVAASDRVLLWRWAAIAPLGTAAFQVGAGRPVSVVSWPAADVLPAIVSDWRIGVAALVVAALVALLACVGWLRGRSSLARALGARTPAPTLVQREVATLATGLGCGTARATLSVRAAVPCAVGSSEICLPLALFGSHDARERRALIAHEIAHLVSGDPRWQRIVGTIARATPFQPLNGWAASRMREAAELAADDAAARVTGDPQSLAFGLAALAGIRAEPRLTAAGGAPLLARVQRLLEGRPVPAPWSRPLRAALALGALLLLAITAPGLSAEPRSIANRIPWLAPSSDAPNSRMLLVRKTMRARRDQLRRTF